MRVRNETQTRFSDEIRNISPIAYFLAFLGFAGIQVLILTLMAHDPKAPPLWGRVGIALFGGVLLAVWVLLIGYVNRDSGQRGMGRVLWTLVAIFVPNALGIVLYFILRKPRLASCPQCGTHVELGFGFCPKCRYRLQPICPHCQRGVQPGDVFCPYCGGALDTTPRAPEPLSGKCV